MTDTAAGSGSFRRISSSAAIANRSSEINDDSDNSSEEELRSLTSFGNTTDVNNTPATSTTQRSRQRRASPTSQTHIPFRRSTSLPSTPPRDANSSKRNNRRSPVDYKDLFCQMINQNNMLINEKLTSPNISLQTEDSAAEGTDQDAKKKQQQKQQQHRQVPQADRESILSELECTVCHEIISPPIQQCRNGQHLICSSCLDSIRVRAEQQQLQQQENPGSAVDGIPKCPTCRESMVEPYRNLALERMASNLLIQCRHVNCYDVVTYSNYKDHIESCDYRPVRCQLCDDMLESWQELWAHQKIKHSTKVQSLQQQDDGKDNSFCFTKELGCKGLKAVVEDRPAGWGKCFSSDIKSFTYNTTINGCGEGEDVSLYINPFFIYMEDTKTLHFGVWEMGSTGKASSRNSSNSSVRDCDLERHILYEISVSSCDGKISVKHTDINSISYRIDVDDIVKHGHKYECLRMTSRTIQRMSYNYTQKVIFQVKPKILPNATANMTDNSANDNEEQCHQAINESTNRNILPSLSALSSTSQEDEENELTFYLS